MMADGLTGLRIRILEKLARGQRAEALLRELSLSLEAMIPGAIVGVTILDRAARVFEGAIFPSLDESYASKLKGAVVAERPGSCALAVYEGRTVVSDDVANDARFQQGWKALSLEHGLGSIQSRPLCAGGATLGTLVLGFAEPRKLDASEERAAATAVVLAGLVLARRRSELQHELMVNELQHRARNIFSTVAAVAHMTLRAYPKVDDFRRMFDGRLAALARAHRLAFDAEVNLRDILQEILAPQGADHAIDMEGPAFTLTPDAAVAFSLAVHELGTNAAKHGCFSVPGGRLSVAWDVARDDRGEAFLEIEWRESDGPAVTPPASFGFGRSTIERSLGDAVDASVSFDFAPTGLCCRIRTPLGARLGALARSEADPAPAPLAPVA